MLKVIIADDEQKICQLLRVLVDWGELGFEIVAEEHNGHDLLQAARAQKPDLIITDIRMPGCSGLELLHNIREENLDIDIIIMSGYRQFDYVKAALQDGAADYLLKPLGRAALKETLEKVRDRRETALEAQSHVERIQKTLNFVSKKLSKALMDEILDGYLKEITIEELNREYDCRFQRRKLWFAVLKLDSKEFIRQRTEEVMGQKIQSIVEGGKERWGISCVHSVRGNRCYLLINEESLEKVERCLYHVIYELKDNLCKLNSGHVTAGLAEVEQGRLNEALEKSSAAVLDQIFRGTDKVLEYREAKGEDKAPPSLDQNRTGQLRDALTGASSEQLASVIRNHLERVRQVRSGKVIYESLCELQEQLMWNCQNLYKDEAVSAVLDKYQRHLSNCCSWRTYEELFLAEEKELMAAIEALRSQKEKQPVRKIKQIVQERYSQNLTLESVAEMLELSPAYVSKLFKKELGITFSQYLTSVRLETAKKLLAATNHSAAQIALLVGYNDEKYFLRAFKKKVGLTTKEYRRLYGE